MKIKKHGQVIYSSIDNTGSTNDASLGARYAKGRLDSTDNNLSQNYFTKDEINSMMTGVAKTYIVEELPPDIPYYRLTEDTVVEADKTYFTVTFSAVASPVVADILNYYELSTETVFGSNYYIHTSDVLIDESKTYYVVDTAQEDALTVGDPIETVEYERASQPTVKRNTYYLVGNDTDGYVLYYFDDNLTKATIGRYDLDLSIYALKEILVGSHDLSANITVQDIFDDIKDYSGAFTSKVIDADDNTITNIELDNFKIGVVKVAMPEHPDDTELLTAKAIDEAKQDKLTVGSEITTVEDTTKVSQIDLTNKKSFPVSAVSIWNYIKEKVTGAISGLLTENLDTSKALISDENGKVAVSEVTSDELAHLTGVVNDLKITSDSGSNAMTYTNSTYTSVTEYDSNVPRRATKFGGMCQLTFQSKGTIAAGSANWLTVGNVKADYRPKQDTPIIVQIFNNGENEAAGGTIKTNGDIRIWVNTKVAGSNYQIRCNALYPV